MFTGIVTALGSVRDVVATDRGFRVAFNAPYDDLQLGESVAVNGACLTVVEVSQESFTVDIVETTRGRTTLADLRVGDQVNLERALAVGDRMGGHFVQGHVDDVGVVTSVVEHDDMILLDVEVPPDVADLCVPHGSIAIDGVSLTINALPADQDVQVALIPHTREVTTLGKLRVGDRVHVEGDMIGKLVHRYLERRNP